MNSTNNSVANNNTDSKTRFCEFCGIEGVVGRDIHEEITVRSGREDWVWACVDYRACQDRQIAQMGNPPHLLTSQQRAERDKGFALNSAVIGWQNSERR